MKKKIFFIMLVFFSIIFSLFPASQGEMERGFKYFKNYSYRKCGLQPQNWAILQDKRGIIYSANSGGILEFDGNTWRAILIPNQEVRSLAIDNNGIIYAGGYGEFGYLGPNDKGFLEYRSLLEYVPEKKRDFSTIWKTHHINGDIYFCSVKYIFRWSPRSKKLKTWESPGIFYATYVCNGQLFLRLKNQGLAVLVNDSIQKIPGGEFFSDKKIFMIIPFVENPSRLLIGTWANGLFTYENEKVIPFPTLVNNYLSQNQAYHGIRLSNGDFAFATRRGGLLVMDAHGQTKYIFDSNRGLQDENVKHILEDRQGNIWLGLDRGISKIEYTSPLFFYDNRSGLPGMVLTVLRHRNNLYTGTTWGLFALADNSKKFHGIPGVSTNCWSLTAIGDSLLAATTNGVFQVTENGTQRLLPNPSYVLHKSRISNNQAWIGSRTGLTMLKLKNNRWEKAHHFEAVNLPVRSITHSPDGGIWLGTLSGIIFKVESYNSTNPGETQISRFGKSYGLPGGEIHTFWARGHVMFATSKGIYLFDEETNRFIPDDSLGKQFAGGGQNVFRVAEDLEKNIWFNSGTRYYLKSFHSGNNPVKRPTFLLRIPPTQVNVIYPETSGKTIWLGSTDGLIGFDAGGSREHTGTFSAYFREVRVNQEEPVLGGHKLRSGYRPVFAHRDRNLSIKCAAPFFEDESSTRFRYFLEGYDDGWSNWTEDPFKDYTNLDAGEYTLYVKAKNVYEAISDEATFNFKILPPWYFTWWVSILYGFGFFILVTLLVKWRSRRLVKEKQKLERIVESRTEEINRKSSQLEHQTVQLQVQAGKLEEMDRIKSRFFANISHEFRTPLTLIMGPLERMLTNRQENGENEKKEMGVMLRNARRLLRLINRLLDLSKMDSGSMKLKTRRHNVSAFLEELTASFQPLAEKKKLKLEYRSESGTTPLYFDAEKLEEAVGNLIGNAIKFTPSSGTVAVSVFKPDFENESNEGNEEQEYINISVKDTGVGISQEQLGHIFDRFYRVEHNEELQTGQKGTGIGLALSREIVALHHGKIDVHSRVEQGTEFIIHLPLGNRHLEPDEIEPELPVKAANTGDVAALYVDEEIQEHESEPGESDRGGDSRDKEDRFVILVVEDNKEVRDFIRRSLEPVYAVVEAVDGMDGIEKAGKIIPDLIVSDIMMPGKDGYQLCDTLKQDIKTSHIPIILLTAKASEESVIHGFETGADDYVTKPFNTNILLARIKNLIDLRTQLQERIQRQLRLEPEEISVPSIDENFLKELQEIVEKNLEDPEFNVETLSKKLYMGRNTLYRKIMALTGEPPNHFIRSYRLKRAAQLLEAQYGNITEVAMAVGFSSNAYFTKCFKEKFHRLPSTFQDSH